MRGLGMLQSRQDARELADQELGRLLVATDLAERDGSRSVAVAVKDRSAAVVDGLAHADEPVGLLDTTSGGRRLARGLGGELLARGLASGRLAGGLLGASHVDV